MTEAPVTTTASRDAACSHCGLHVPEALRSADLEEPQFCCSGCEAVYHAIHELGLDRFYDLREAGDRTDPADDDPSRSYAEFDDPEFQKSHVRVVAADDDGQPNSLEVTLFLEGLHCSACVWLIEHLSNVTPGVEHIRVDLGRSRATLRYRPTTKLSTIARRVASLGYPVHPYREDSRERAARAEDRAFWVRLALCGAVAGNVMLLSFALYGGAFSGMASEYESLFRWVSAILSTPAVIWGGGVFFRGAALALRRGSLHMDLPISLGILGGYVGGLVNTVRASGETYFDSVTALIFLLLVGRYLERRQRRRAAEASDLLRAVTPRHARRVDGDHIVEVPIDTLRTGDTVALRPGDPVPADGVIVEGASRVDTSLLTGEPIPREAGVGAPIFAGWLNVTSPLRIRVERVGEQSRVGQLMDLVETMTAERSTLVRVADRISGVFVGTVIVLAGLTALAWSLLDPTRALDHTVALLVVTCPCALGLATPLAVSAALGRAASAGMLIRGGEIFETLTRPGHVWLDKTGTLTQGELTVGSPSTVAGVDPVQLLDHLARLEAQSVHPIGRALVRAATSTDAHETPRVQDLAEYPGRGVTGVIDGRAYRVGSPSWIEAECGAFPRTLVQATAEALEAGHSVVAVAIDRKVSAVVTLSDPVRPDASAAIAALREHGWTVGILSGDHPKVVTHVAAQLGISSENALGGLSPEEKIERVRLTSRRPVVMAGDGVNDAAAMAAADVGVSVRGGAEAALAASDVYLSRGGLVALADLVTGARSTFRVIRRNLAFSIFYNAIGASLAITGWIGPLVAAVLMPLSSLTVTVSSYRGRSFRDRSSDATPSLPTRKPKELRCP